MIRFRFHETDLPEKQWLNQKRCLFLLHTSEVWRKAVQACFGRSTEWWAPQTSPPGATRLGIRLYSRHWDRGRQAGMRLVVRKQPAVCLYCGEDSNHDLSPDFLLILYAVCISGTSIHLAILPGNQQRSNPLVPSGSSVSQAGLFHSWKTEHEATSGLSKKGFYRRM